MGNVKFNLEGGTTKSTQRKDLPNPNVPKYKIEKKSKNIQGKGTINLGKLNITLGGQYGSGKAKESLPDNIFNIPSKKSKQIFRKLETQLGYKIDKDKAINVKMSKSKLNNLPSKQGNISFGLTGKLGKGTFNIDVGKSGTKYGKASIKVPFSTGGKVHRGRKAVFT